MTVCVFMLCTSKTKTVKSFFHGLRFKLLLSLYPENGLYPENIHDNISLPKADPQLRYFAVNLRFLSLTEGWLCIL